MLVLRIATYPGAVKGRQALCFAKFKSFHDIKKNLLYSIHVVWRACDTVKRNSKCDMAHIQVKGPDTLRSHPGSTQPSMHLDLHG